MADPLTLVHAVALQHLAPFLDDQPWNESKHQRLIELRPNDSDLPLAFLPSMEAQARALYSQLWANPPPLLPKPGQTQLPMHCALSDDFLAWNERGREFPGGYRKLAPHLQPGRVWVAWKFVAPGDLTGLSFDGMVWLEERLVWFPQPWRLVPIGS